MRKLIALAAFALAAFATDASAQSAKSSVQVGHLAVVSAQNATAAGNWSNVMSTTIHTSQQKDLVVDVSLEAGLFTDTLVTSSRNRPSGDTSYAEAMIEVRVLVDGVSALPASVIYARRAQTLMARFGGILESCTDSNADGVIDGDECEWTDEELQLVLDTMGAHSFNFLLDNVGSGTHTITVQARTTTNTSSTSGSSNARAVLGNGSLVVEEVRLVNGASITL